MPDQGRRQFEESRDNAERADFEALVAERDRLRQFVEWVASYDGERQLVGSGVIEKATRMTGRQNEASCPRYWCDIRGDYVPLDEHSPMSLAIYRADPQAWHRLHPQDPAEFADRDTSGSAGAALEAEDA